MTGRIKQTHCSKGHEFTPENTRISTQGGQICITCNREYQRIRRGPTKYKHNDLVGNFAKKIIMTESCWLWAAGKSGPYGQFGGDFAHRVSYREFKGPIPEGLFVLHSCDIPICVNPDHLFLGTQNDNIQDALNKDRIARGEQQGLSKLTEENVIEARQLYRTGKISQPQLAQMYGVCQATIYEMLARKTWAHIKEES